MELMLSTHDVEMLKSRQASIADRLVNNEFEYEEDFNAAEKDYYSTINILYVALGENAPCRDIDPLLYEKFKQCYNDGSDNLSRKQINIKLGICH